MAKSTNVRLVKSGAKKKRVCSGSCDGVKVGPIDCPEGTSPHLDCTVNPPTLKCVKNSISRKKNKCAC